MITSSLPLLLLTLALLAGAAWFGYRKLRHRFDEPALPTEWLLTPRPVFNEQERRVHRQLREALPQHVILAKLPLVRFCHPSDPSQVRFWFDLLGATHVGFAICNQGGRVLAAIDLEDSRGPARRSTLIKQAVLAACQIRYVRYPADQTPSVPELQVLVPAGAEGPDLAVAGATTQPAGAVMRGGFSPAVRNVEAFRQRTHPARWPDAQGHDSSSFGRDAVISGFSHGVATIALPERGGEVVDVPPTRH